MAWYGDDSDDGLRPFDVYELYDDAGSVAGTAIDATGDESIEIEINIVDKYDFEVGLNCSRLDKTFWETDLDSLRVKLVELYPEADWEDSGWR